MPTTSRRSSASGSVLLERKPMKVPNNTAPGTGRNCDTEMERKAFDPDDTWSDDFQKQLTPKMVDSVRSFARMRGLFVASAGRKVDDYYARELVQDAIGDTWAGVLRWDPTRCTLQCHLVSAIESRTKHQRQHVKENPHDAFGDAHALSERAENDASMLVADSELALTRVYALETVAQIRELATADKPVLRLL